MTQELLKELFEYKDGQLLRKTKRGGKTKGAPTGCDNGFGYLVTGVNYKLYPTHRLIFLYHSGYLPNVIDHINGNKQDNRIENLREATVSQNNYNCKKRKTNTSGHKNVYWDKTRNKWMVNMRVERRGKHIGYFDNIEDAIKAAIEARIKYHKEFANHDN